MNVLGSGCGAIVVKSRTTDQSEVDITVIAYTLAKPYIGKRATAENRARGLAEIYARHGASVKLASVVSGYGAGCIVVIRAYADFGSAAKAFTGISNDPAHADFWREREADPAAEIVIERDIYRTAYGDLRWDTHPMSHVRQYEMTRDKLSEALRLLPKVEKIVSQADVNVVALLPVTGENLSSMSISYQFQSIDHWGETLDTVGTSEAFQAIVAEAAAFGTLRSAFSMVPL